MRRGSDRRALLRRAAQVTAVALALPLAGCATTGTGGGIDLVRAGCPADIRVQTDDLPGVEWGFLYSLLDPEHVDIRDQAGEASAPLVTDGESTGVTLTILTGDPLDGVSANVDLYDDDELLLAAVDTDAAALDAVRYPTVGLFAPTLRDSRMIYWDAGVYPGVRSIEGLGDTLAPDGLALVPIIAAPGDPFRDFMVGEHALGPEQVLPDYAGGIQSFLDAGGVSAQQGDTLVDSYLLGLPTGAAHPFGFQLLDDAGYPRDTLLSARPQTIVRYSDCFEVLIPLLQRALADYLDDPDATTELIVELSARFGYPEYDADLAAFGLETLTTQRIAGTGRDETIGDVDMGRVRELLEDVAPAWEEVDVDVPPDLEPDDLATNHFIDRSIGADPRG